MCIGDVLDILVECVIDFLRGVGAVSYCVLQKTRYRFAVFLFLAINLTILCGSWVEVTLFQFQT